MLKNFPTKTKVLLICTVVAGVLFIGLTVANLIMH